MSDYDSEDVRIAKQKIARLEAKIASMELGVIRCKSCRFRDFSKMSADDLRPFCWQTAWYVEDEMYCFMAEPGEPLGLSPKGVCCQ